MDMFRAFDNQYPALQPFFHHSLLEDDRLGRRDDFVFGAVDDKGRGVVAVVAELVKGVDCVEAGLRRWLVSLVWGKEERQVG